MSNVPGRGALRFSLASLFLLVTVAATAAWFGVQVRLVGRRHAMCRFIVQHDGMVESAEEWNAQYVRRTSSCVPAVRAWLGDDAVARIRLPYGAKQADLERAKGLFPEAELIEIARHAPRPGDGYF